MERADQKSDKPIPISKKTLFEREITILRKLVAGGLPCLAGQGWRHKKKA
ncbi:hypothetical protein BRCON_1989 [Candidatus Sumerlaea chitinivorans]|uniref:Uncharacterized protein n=1 Tax=Sumerlaea chitinivorans TaxID=2250252 RepID=A0A2Z4Y6Y5_SUMC1|nr:hypothetical protein BRCON_1989 [Candidatus Sumerlaea chitinivorans]